MSLLMGVCCCGQCDCPTTVCHTFYYIQLEIITTDCEGNYPCNAGVHYYFSALHYSNSCTPPSAADILATYKAGNADFCPAEGIINPCGQGNPTNQIQTEYIYPSCTLVSSVQDQICSQTYSYPSVGPFRYSHDPILIGNYTSGFSQTEMAYNLYIFQYWKVQGFPNPQCGTDVDYGVFGVSFTTPPCIGNAPAGCCP